MSLPDVGFWFVTNADNRSMPESKREKRTKRLPQRLDDESVTLTGYVPKISTTKPGTTTLPSSVSVPTQPSSGHFDPLRNTAMNSPTKPATKLTDAVTRSSPLRKRSSSRPTSSTASHLPPSNFEPSLESPLRHESTFSSDPPAPAEMSRKELALLVGRFPTPEKTLQESRDIAPSQPRSQPRSRPRPRKTNKVLRQRPVRSVEYLEEVLDFFQYALDMENEHDERNWARKMLAAGESRKLYTTKCPMTNEIVENDFLSSDMGEIEEQPPLIQSGPKIFLADLQKDIAAAIYKALVRDCHQYCAATERSRTFFTNENRAFEGKDVSWMMLAQRLLRINLGDQLWLENWRRDILGLSSVALLPVEEAAWHGTPGFVRENEFRALHPSNADYEWTQRVRPQVEEIRRRDMVRAKQYLAERGIRMEALGFEMHVELDDETEDEVD